MIDIYFAKEYGQLSELIDEGPCCRFELKTDKGYILNQFIKRSVPFIINGIQYYDIVTPYGYGGPIVIESKNKEELLEEYRIQFAEYCLRENIICEFIRYHPIIKNYLDFSTIYDNVYSRHTVGTNLKDYDDPVLNEFSKSARKEVRKGEKAGVTCLINPHPSELSVFKSLYKETMDRNHAEAMYYFPEMYYQILTDELRDYVLEIQAVCDGEIIASEIYFISSGIMHAHLLGSSSKLLEIGGGAILEATAANWGKANGYSYIHHGGGRTSAEDDPLYFYKKKFGKHTEFDFYIGKKVWNHEIYELAVKMRELKGGIKNPDYFPVYRA